MVKKSNSHDTEDDNSQEGYPMPLEIPPGDEPGESDDDDDDNTSTKSNHNTTGAKLTPEEKQERDEIVPYLLKHAYHLPGNNWRQDWYQYQANNHPVFGIWLHHRFHPLHWKIRVVSLVGSMLLGLVLTNMVYLAFVFVDQDSEQTLLSAEAVAKNGVTGNSYVDETIGSVGVTTGNLVLWFVGAPIHGVYDTIAWSLMGCGCCRFASNNSWWAKLCRTSGAFVVTFGVIAIFCVASFASLLRAAYEADEDVVEITINTTNITNITDFINLANLTTLAPTEAIYTEEEFANNNMTMNMTDLFKDDSSAGSGGSYNIIYDSTTIVQDQLLTLVKDQNFENYKFVLSFFVELLMSYLLFYPLVGTLFFMGAFSCCGRYPIFHGRRYEVEQLQAKQRAEQEAALMEPGIEVELGKDLKEQQQSEDVESVSSSKTDDKSKNKKKSNKNKESAVPLAKERSTTNTNNNQPPLVEKEPASTTTTTSTKKSSKSSSKRKSSATATTTKAKEMEPLVVSSSKSTTTTNTGKKETKKDGASSTTVANASTTKKSAKSTSNTTTKKASESTSSSDAKKVEKNPTNTTKAKKENKTATTTTKEGSTTTTTGSSKQKSNTSATTTTTTTKPKRRSTTKRKSVPPPPPPPPPPS